jgi:hypothetical protein
MRVAIVQSNYLPWRGYFSLISSVDLFIFHDDLQYTKGDWRNRNLFLNQNKKVWLTIPCGTNLNRNICDVELPQNKWNSSHYNSLSEWYKKSENFETFKVLLKEMYLRNEFRYLSDFNQHWIKYISKEILSLRTHFADSREFHLKGTKQERLIELIKKTGASEYLSGPAAKDYIDVDDFKNNGIELYFADYSKLPGNNSNSESLSILHDIFSYKNVKDRIGAL